MTSLGAAREKDAIEVHSDQAHEFARSYQDLARDRYATCFTYSRARLERWLDELLPAVDGGARLLDVGCGTGSHLARFAARGFEVTGVDGSRAMLEQARKPELAGALHQADVRALPFPSGKFDVVTSIEVLRYLADPMPCLREMSRVLRPGGICVATAMPLFSVNGYWLINRLANLLRLPGFVSLKQFFTTERRLATELADAGFEAIEIHGVYFGPINWVERLAPRQTPAFLRRWEAIDARIADRPLLRAGSNMFVIRARKRSK